MTLVVDSSVVVAALVDNGEVGRWAEGILLSGPLAAPHLMPGEVANVLRRMSAAGQIGPATAWAAHADLLELRVDLFPYRVCAARVWDLRDNVTSYDGWYVAVAELLSTRLATLDVRLSRATGPHCDFALPPGRA